MIPGEPRWHRTTRALFIVAFFLVWLEAVSCFAYFGVLARGASPIPTPEFSAGIVNHGHVFYVAARQKHLYQLLLTSMGIGIPTIMATAFLLHYVVGVKIFRNRP